MTHALEREGAVCYVVITSVFRWAFRRARASRLRTSTPGPASLVDSVGRASGCRRRGTSGQLEVLPSSCARCSSSRNLADVCASLALGRFGVHAGEGFSGLGSRRSYSNRQHARGPGFPLVRRSATKTAHGHRARRSLPVVRRTGDVVGERHSDGHTADGRLRPCSREAVTLRDVFGNRPNDHHDAVRAAGEDLRDDAPAGAEEGVLDPSALNLVANMTFLTSPAWRGVWPRVSEALSPDFVAYFDHRHGPTTTAAF